MPFPAIYLHSTKTAANQLFVSRPCIQFNLIFESILRISFQFKFVMGFSRPAKRPRTDASGLPDASPEALHSTVYRETRIEVIAADATTFPIASIVNAANTGLRGGGGIDGAIHNAAGPDLLAELKRVYPFGCLVGEAHPTDAHNIQTTQHIIHAVGPDYRRQVYRGNEERAYQHLHDAYTNSMQAAMDRGATSIAFPTISTGIFEFPPELASRIAMAAVRAFVDQQTHFRFERVVFLVWSPEGESPDLKHYNANFE
jgi:O-acetyl-ADP-ribose deacetylase